MRMTLQRLRELLDYDPSTGEFRWKMSKRGIWAGAIAGYVGPKGYRVIRIEGINYSAHRIAWMLSHGRWPRHELDHIDLIKDDNRLANLREATHAQNSRNSRVRITNKTGFKGASFDRFRKQWKAHITIEGRTKHLGRFATAEEAHAAYWQAATQLHGVFARAS